MNTLLTLVLSGFLNAVSPSLRVLVPTDACTLLTQAQVTAALGVAVTAGTHVVPRSTQTCGWAPAGGPRIGGKKVTVTIMSEASFTRGKTPVEGVTKTPVSGIGDDAYFVTTPALGAAVSVKRGNFCFQVRVGGLPPDKEQAVAKTLALDVIGKL